SLLPSADSAWEWGRFAAASRPAETPPKQAARAVPGQGRAAFAKAPLLSRVDWVQGRERHRHFRAKSRRHHRKPEEAPARAAWAVPAWGPRASPRPSSPVSSLARRPADRSWPPERRQAIAAAPRGRPLAHYRALPRAREPWREWLLFSRDEPCDVFWAPCVA